MSQQHTLITDKVRLILATLRQQIKKSYYPLLLSDGKTVAGITRLGCPTPLQEICWEAGEGFAAGHHSSWSLKESLEESLRAEFVSCRSWGRGRFSCSLLLPKVEILWREELFRGYNQRKESPAVAWDIQTGHWQKLLQQEASALEQLYQMGVWWMFSRHCRQSHACLWFTISVDVHTLNSASGARTPVFPNPHQAIELTLKEGQSPSNKE